MEEADNLRKKYQLVLDVLDRCLYLIAIPSLSGQASTQSLLFNQVQVLRIIFGLGRVFLCGSVISDGLIALAGTVRPHSAVNLLFPTIHSLWPAIVTTMRDTTGALLAYSASKHSSSSLHCPIALAVLFLVS